MLEAVRTPLIALIALIAAAMLPAAAVALALAAPATPAPAAAAAGTPAAPTTPATPTTPGASRPAATGAASPAGAQPGPAARLAPCRVPGIDEELRCGTYEVWEDREARRGRRIALNVLVLPALSPHPAPDAVVFLHGGPGAAATQAAGFLAPNKRLRQHRDVLLVDQRGTGRSHPLDCDLYGAGSHTKGPDLKLLTSDMFPPAAIRECRDRLEKVADLRLYTTGIAMDDVDEVRAWLGYPQLDLIGGSYGTRAAQVFLRRHPRVVRSVVLDGVAPVDEPIPLHHAYAGKRAVDLLLAECAADAACHAAFPNLAQELAEVMARFDRGVQVRIPDASSGGTVEVAPGRGLIAEGLRFLSYDSGARRLPLVVHQAYQGDLAQLVTLALDRWVQLDRILSIGENFSVTCAEDLPFIDDAAAARLTAGTLLGDYRIRQQQRVCTIWPRAPVPADLHQPVRSEVPVLLFSGERDPVTPPEFGERVAKFLPNSLHVVVPHSGHGSAGPCAEGIIDRFVETASVQGLDTSCVAKTQPPRFVVKEPVEVHLAPKLLDSYAGTYALPGFTLTLVRRGDHLVVQSPNTADLEVFADARDHFFARSADFEMQMTPGGAGAPLGLVLELGTEELRGKRLP
jgi:pimeloyl-ACP methyl ester carboxylesterase